MPDEKVALAKVEEAYAAYIAERDKPVGRDEQKLKQLEQNWKDAIAAADKFSAAYNNEFAKIIEAEGGEGLNAFTNLDETGYHYSLPINRLELWAYLESERFLHPVMRQFYKERNVVIEERRMRTDSDPMGRLARTIHGRSLCRASVSSADHWLDLRFEFFFSHRRAEFLRQILRALEHGGHCRGRRESGGSHADCGEIFLPHPGASQARHSDYQRASTEFGAYGGAPRAVAADLSRRLPPPRLPQP